MKICESIPREQPILFVPDRNLARYVVDRTGRTNLIACAYLEKGMFQEAEASTQKQPGQEDNVWSLAMRAYVAGRTGHRDEARRFGNIRQQRSEDCTWLDNRCQKVAGHPELIKQFCGPPV